MVMGQAVDQRGHLAVVVQELAGGKRWGREHAWAVPGGREEGQRDGGAGKIEDVLSELVIWFCFMFLFEIF